MVANPIIKMMMAHPIKYDENSLTIIIIGMN